MSVSIHDKDTGYKAFQKLIKELIESKAHVKVGVLGKNDERSDGLTNVELATIHEFGAPSARIPERSFIRSSFDNHQQEYGTLIRKGLERVSKGHGSIDQVFGAVGAKAASDIKKGITQGAGIPPPNAARTISEKGSSRPLVDTGQLVNSITWELGGKAQGGE